MLRRLLLGLIPILAAATPLNLEPFEELHNVPEDWSPLGAPSADTRINFKIALNAEDDAALEALIREISDPSSPKYGHYLSTEELNQRLQPSAAGVQSVKRWLTTVGAQDVKHSQDEIHFTASVEQANAMMNTKFLRYKHEKRQSEAIRTTKVHLPRNVMKHISMIHPTTRFESLEPMKSVIYKKENLDASRMDPTSDICRGVIIPQCLQELYNIEGVKIRDPDPAKIGSIAIGGFLGQHPQFSDLDRFLKAETEVVNGTFSWSSLNGGKLTQGISQKTSEANLDIQYSMALTHPMKNAYISTGGNGPWVADLDQPTADSNDNEPYYEFFDHQLKAATRPHTISISYGESEHSVPASYARTVCSQIGKLGLLGVSVVIASGDFGVGTHCQSNDGQQRPRFQPVFPTACPWATSVGGTTLILEDMLNGPTLEQVTKGAEEAWNNTSGGFSDLWPRPWYQQAQVEKYLTEYSDKAFDSYYTRTGRGFPDIAAQSVHYLVYDKNRPILISGTSASAPVIAGIIALLNAERLQNGQPTLGFLNPWIYQQGANMLNDVQIGFAEGCHGRNIRGLSAGSIIEGATWVATVGWDPVTGMGTPDFRRMLAQLPKSTGKVLPEILHAPVASPPVDGIPVVNSGQGIVGGAKGPKGAPKGGKAGAGPFAKRQDAAK